MNTRVLTDNSNPFRLPFNNRFFADVLESVLCLKPLAQCYEQRPRNITQQQLLEYMLKWLGVTVNTLDENKALETIPRKGPLLVVANHPLGGLEGIAIMLLLLKLRPDLKVMTNKLLTLIPEFKSLFIGVDNLSSVSKRMNYKSLKEADRYLKDGGCLLIFPAGKVAAVNLKSRKVEEHPWNRIVGQLVKRNKTDCLPIHVRGHNSKLFYGLGLIHPRLRTLMLPREVANKKNSTLELEIGSLVSHQELRHLDSDKSITDYLYISTSLMGPKDRSYTPPTQAFQNADETINSPELIFKQLDEFRIVETERFDVYCAPFDSIGPVMKYIGMAREYTFREANVGTGNVIDSDEFDPYYLHLFAIDKKQSRLVGGYRIGKVDEIVKQHGVKALYSRTTYRFDEKYLEKIEHPLEIGRSFVHPDYQRNPAALDMLWKGIGAFVAENPQYHTLYGGVSISREHSDLARALIAECMLESFRAEQRFLEDVRPVKEIRIGGKPWTRAMLNSINHIAVINKLVGRCDPGKAVPTLIRHYLALNGKFVCFALNEGFNNSLDGLILVDLRTTPKKYLQRYLGKQKAEEFLEKWQVI